MLVAPGVRGPAAVGENRVEDTHPFYCLRKMDGACPLLGEGGVAPSPATPTCLARERSRGSCLSVRSSACSLTSGSAHLGRQSGSPFSILRRRRRKRGGGWRSCPHPPSVPPGRRGRAGGLPSCTRLLRGQGQFSGLHAAQHPSAARPPTWPVMQRHHPKAAALFQL